MKTSRQDTFDDTKNVQKILSKVSAADFDGHTEFQQLSPEMKLQWLSECAKFASEIRSDDGSHKS